MGGMVSILDLQCRMERVVEQWGEFQQIVWQFYEKTINSPYCIMDRLAMVDQIMVTTCVQEVIGRMQEDDQQGI